MIIGFQLSSKRETRSASEIERKVRQPIPSLAISIFLALKLNSLKFETIVLYMNFFHSFNILHIYNRIINIQNVLNTLYMSTSFYVLRYPYLVVCLFLLDLFAERWLLHKAMQRATIWSLQLWIPLFHTPPRVSALK